MPMFVSYFTPFLDPLFIGRMNERFVIVAKQIERVLDKLGRKGFVPLRVSFVQPDGEAYKLLVEIEFLDCEPEDCLPAECGNGREMNERLPIEWAIFRQ